MKSNINNKKIRILALSWRDIKRKDMGGAEILSHEMFKCVKDGEIEITHISPMIDGLPNMETIDGVKYLRMGNVVTVIPKAINYYLKNKSGFDFVIDQCNTHRFFTPLWVKKNKRIFFIHQLTREIWYINMKAPFSWIGAKLETLLLRMNRNDYTITVSKSTRDDLIEVGYNPNKIHIVPIGLSDKYIQRNVKFLNEKSPNFIYVGRYAAYKGIDVSVSAFCMVKKKYMDAKLWIVGKKNEEYIKRYLLPLCQSNSISIGDSEDNDIVTWGFVSEEKKIELQSKAKALVFPSTREGWGMIITEAGACGTPSITFNAPGMRDAVDFGKAGYLCTENSVEEVYDKMIQCIENKDEYVDKCKSSYEFANKFSFDKSRHEFRSFINDIYHIEE